MFGDVQTVCETVWGCVKSTMEELFWITLTFTAIIKSLCVSFSCFLNSVILWCQKGCWGCKFHAAESPKFPGRSCYLCVVLTSSVGSFLHLFAQRLSAERKKYLCVRDCSCASSLHSWIKRNSDLLSKILLHRTSSGQKTSLSVSGGYNQDFQIFSFSLTVFRLKHSQFWPQMFCCYFRGSDVSCFAYLGSTQQEELNGF